MIRSFVEEDGRLLEGDASLARHAGVRWIDIEAQTEQEVRWLGATFAFHPLALEDCLHRNQRAKVDQYPGSIFFVLHAFDAPEDRPEAITLRELHAFLAPDLLVTVHAEPNPEIESVRAALRQSPMQLRAGPDELLHRIWDAIFDRQAPLLESFHELLDEIEDRVRHAGPSLLEEIFALKHALASMRRALGPARDVLFSLAKGGVPQIGERSRLYFRDISDHAARNADTLEAARERTNDILEAYHLVAAHRTNGIVQRLTLFSAVFLPLTFITGFFGMNFLAVPFGDERLMWGAIAGMAVLPAIMVGWFRRARLL